MMDEKRLFIRLVKKHVTAVEREVPGVRANKDIEHLHRMRVALRRLKSTLSDFKDLLPSREYGSAADDLRKLLRSLGQARDIDTKIVFLQSLTASPVAARHLTGIREIIDELREDRGEVQPKIVRNLGKAQQRRIFRSILSLRPSLEDTGITVDEWAKGRILTRLEKMLSLEPYVRKPACIKELHEMRIAAKGFRYTLENLELFFGKRLVPFARAAMRVQRALGEMHNYDVWLGLIKILEDSSGRDACFRKAVFFLSEECHARREKAYRSFVSEWSLLKKRKAWARLGFFALDRK